MIGHQWKDMNLRCLDYEKSIDFLGVLERALLLLESLDWQPIGKNPDLDFLSVGIFEFEGY